MSKQSKFLAEVSGEPIVGNDWSVWLHALDILTNRRTKELLPYLLQDKTEPFLVFPVIGANTPELATTVASQQVTVLRLPVKNLRIVNRKDQNHLQQLSQVG